MKTATLVIGLGLSTCLNAQANLSNASAFESEDVQLVELVESCQNSSETPSEIDCKNVQNETNDEFATLYNEILESGELVDLNLMEAIAAEAAATRTRD